jgi:TRAP-type C4-dicarboxylate transport system permease small subunit
MDSLRSVARVVDDAVFQVERVLLLVAVAGMTVLVSLDVVQRTFSRPEGRIASMLVALLSPATPEARERIVGVVAPMVFGAAALLLCILAAHSAALIRAERAGRPPSSMAHSAARGLAVCLAGWLFVKAELWLFPSSLPGAQKFALGFMLWAGMLGASIATRTRRHIVIDTVTKGLDPDTGRLYALIGGIVTALFCGFVAWLGFIQLTGEFRDWSGGEGVGVYDALPVPLWVRTLAVPFAFTVMSVRFFGAAVRDFVYGAPVGGVDAHGVDLEALAKTDVNGEAA